MITGLAIAVITWLMALAIAIIAIQMSWQRIVDDLRTQLKAATMRNEDSEARVDKWRTKARVLQGKYEPIGRVIASGRIDMITPGETVEIELEPTITLGPGESITVDLHSVDRWWDKGDT